MIFQSKLITKRDLGINHGGIRKKLEILPGFHLYITEINSKHQLSFLYSLKVELMLLLAILKRLKGFKWFLSCLKIVEFSGRWSCIINLLIALVTNVLVNKMLVGSEEKLMCHTFARFYVIIRSMLLYIQIIT